MEIKPLKVKDKVFWTSQSAGSSKKKTGRIVYELSSHLNPCKIANRYFPGHKRMFDGLSIPGGHPKGYLVEVKDGRRKPKLYMPYPNQLRHDDG